MLIFYIKYSLAFVILFAYGVEQHMAFKQTTQQCCSKIISIVKSAANECLLEK